MAGRDAASKVGEEGDAARADASEGARVGFARRKGALLATGRRVAAPYRSLGSSLPRCEGCGARAPPAGALVERADVLRY